MKRIQTDTPILGMDGQPIDGGTVGKALASLVFARKPVNGDDGVASCALALKLFNATESVDLDSLEIKLCGDAIQQNTRCFVAGIVGQIQSALDKQ